MRYVLIRLAEPPVLAVRPVKRDNSSAPFNVGWCDGEDQGVWYSYVDVYHSRMLQIKRMMRVYNPRGGETQRFVDVTLEFTVSLYFPFSKSDCQTIQRLEQVRRSSQTARHRDGSTPSWSACSWPMPPLPTLVRYRSPCIHRRASGDEGCCRC